MNNQRIKCRYCKNIKVLYYLKVFKGFYLKDACC